MTSGRRGSFLPLPGSAAAGPFPDGPAALFGPALRDGIVRPSNKEWSHASPRNFDDAHHSLVLMLDSVTVLDETPDHHGSVKEMTTFNSSATAMLPPPMAGTFRLRQAADGLSRAGSFEKKPAATLGLIDPVL